MTWFLTRWLRGAEAPLRKELFDSAALCKQLIIVDQDQDQVVNVHRAIAVNIGIGEIGAVVFRRG